MTRHRTLSRAAALAVLALGAVAFAGCGSSSTASSTTTTTGSSVITGSTTTTPLVTVNIPVTPAVRTALVAAGAKLFSLPIVDFNGLKKHRTFLAYDAATGTFWAGAQLVAASGSTPGQAAAQVAVQDDGSYLLFTKKPTTAWVAYPDGLGGSAFTNCAIVVPTAIRAVWGWSQSAPCGAPS